MWIPVLDVLLRTHLSIRFHEALDDGSQLLIDVEGFSVDHDVFTLDVNVDDKLINVGDLRSTPAVRPMHENYVLNFNAKLFFRTQ